MADQPYHVSCCAILVLSKLLPSNHAPQQLNKTVYKMFYHLTTPLQLHGQKFSSSQTAVTVCKKSANGLFKACGPRNIMVGRAVKRSPYSFEASKNGNMYLIHDFFLHVNMSYGTLFIV